MNAQAPQQIQIQLQVNGQPVQATVEPRLLLSDFLRHQLGLTGTHVGCEHGVCGACTVLLNDEPVRACLMFAVQAAGHAVRTVEDLASSAGDGEQLHPLQAAFQRSHALQCGFCTPGILMSMLPFLADNPSPTETQIRQALSGNLCRCTGYQHIVDAVVLAAAGGREEAASAAGESAPGEGGVSGPESAPGEEPAPAGEGAP